MVEQNAEALQSLVDLGFTYEQASEALNSYGSLDSAADWLFGQQHELEAQFSSNAAASTSASAAGAAAPPIHGKPPEYEQAVKTSSPYVEVGKAPTTPPASPAHKPMLMLPAPPPPHPALHYQQQQQQQQQQQPLSKEEADLQQAIMLSQQQQYPQQQARTTPVPDIDLTKEEDEEMSKALEMSMASLRSADQDIGIPFLKEPAERMRIDDLPVALRSTSHNLDSLCAYLQCLYALQPFRNWILSFRPSEKAASDEPRSYEGFWKGESNHAPDAARQLSQIGVVWALQRLFAFMALSKRSYCHVTDVERSLDINKAAMMSPGPGVFQEYHNAVTTSLFYARTATLRNTLSDEDMEQVEDSMDDVFTVRGREVPNDKLIAMPLPPMSRDEIRHAGVQCLVAISDPSVFPNTLYRAIDRRLVYRKGEIESLALCASFPQTLVVSVCTQSSYEAQWISPADRHLLEIPEQLFLDRYALKNRAKIQQLRKEGAELEESRREAIEQRQKLLSSASSVRDRSSADLLQHTRDRLAAQAASGHDGLDAVRRERQAKLAEQFSLILDKLKERIEYFDGAIETLNKNIDGLFEQPAMKQYGPYQLYGIVMANGLNSRGSCWSVTRDHRGRWIKVVDGFAKEISLDEALKDRSGIAMNAGAVMLTYQLADEPVNSALRRNLERGKIPLHLQAAAEMDNEAFASELPDDKTRSWRHPASDAELSDPTLSFDTDEEVQMVWEPAPAEPGRPPNFGPEGQENVDPNLLAMDATDPISAPAVDSGVAPAPKVLQPVRVNEAIPVDSALSLGDRFDAAARTDTPMSLDSSSEPQSRARSPTLVGSTVDDESDAQMDDPAPLRLRGGSGVSHVATADDDEDDYEDEEEDEMEETEEDEVELGLLRPFNESEWDVDLSVGKVGGLPRWTDPASPLRGEQIACSVCGKHQRLLLQLNSPDDTQAHAAARTLYLFSCKNAQCVTRDMQGATSLWRIQMSSPNDFFPPSEEAQRKRQSLEAQLRPNEGFADTMTFSGSAWPQFDLYCESEPYADEVSSTVPDALITEISTSNGNGTDTQMGTDDGEDPDAKEEDTKVAVDRAFLDFQERLERLPGQVLRFYRLPGVVEPNPLWISNERIESDQVQPCEQCGAPRKVEFQVLGTVLNYLKEYDLPLDSWYALTCERNCDIAKGHDGRTGWAKEVIVSRQFTHDGHQMRN